jgi:hypothetical protein
MNHRTKAAEHFARAEESVERCDTDGFVSQWANGVCGRLELAKAELAENNGECDQLVLVDANGDLVPAKLIPTQYGSAWLLSPEVERKYGRKFVPVGARSRVQRNLGLAEDRRKMPSYARLHGSGTGLAGAASVQVVVKVDYEALGWDW